MNGSLLCMSVQYYWTGCVLPMIEYMLQGVLLDKNVFSKDFIPEKIHVTELIRIFSRINEVFVFMPCSVKALYITPILAHLLYCIIFIWLVIQVCFTSHLKILQTVFFPLWLIMTAHSGR